MLIVLFEIELVSFVDPKSEEENEELLPPDQRREASFLDTLTKASAFKEVNCFTCNVTFHAIWVI